MNIKLIKENEAPLLARKRLTFEIDYPGSKTPSKGDIKKTIASLQKVKEELIAVRHIYQKFGKNKAKIIAHFYTTLKDLKRYEPKSKKEEKKVESASKEEKKVESASKEEKKVESASKEEKKVESAPAEKPQEEKSNAKEESKEQKTK